MNLSEQLYKKLEEASNEWAEWQKKVIILDEGKKGIFSQYKKILQTKQHRRKRRSQRLSNSFNRKNKQI